jgi:hypothetical protein
MHTGRLGYTRINTGKSCRNADNREQHAQTGAEANGFGTLLRLGSAAAFGRRRPIPIWCKMEAR